MEVNQFDSKRHPTKNNHKQQQQRTNITTDKWSVQMQLERAREEKARGRQEGDQTVFGGKVVHRLTLPYANGDLAGPCGGTYGCAYGPANPPTLVLNVGFEYWSACSDRVGPAWESAGGACER